MFLSASFSLQCQSPHWPSRHWGSGGPFCPKARNSILLWWPKAISHALPLSPSTPLLVASSLESLHLHLYGRVVSHGGPDWNLPSSRPGFLCLLVEMPRCQPEQILVWQRTDFHQQERRRSFESSQPHREKKRRGLEVNKLAFGADKPDPCS